MERVNNWTSDPYFGCKWAGRILSGLAVVTAPYVWTVGQAGLDNANRNICDMLSRSLPFAFPTCDFHAVYAVLWVVGLVMAVMFLIIDSTRWARRAALPHGQKLKAIISRIALRHVALLIIAVGVMGSILSAQRPHEAPSSLKPSQAQPTEQKPLSVPSAQKQASQTRPEPSAQPAKTEIAHARFLFDHQGHDVVLMSKTEGIKKATVELDRRDLTSNLIFGGPFLAKFSFQNDDGPFDISVTDVSNRPIGQMPFWSNYSVLNNEDRFVEISFDPYRYGNAFTINMQGKSSEVLVTFYKK